MSGDEPRGLGAVPSEFEENRRRFLALVNEVRRDLHRYCARMVGSIADGEDIVQDTLARAYYELSELNELPTLRPWLFRIAHNRALDYLRRYERRMSEPLEAVMDMADDAAPDPGSTPEREEAVRLAVSRFLEIAPAQRSCIILKDVLEHSIEEIATMFEMSVPAVKAALHRGRARLHQLSWELERGRPTRTLSKAATRYAQLFNARDWDGVRAMLADEVKLDLVSREKRSGHQNIRHYFDNYNRTRDWQLVAGWLDDREVLAVFRGSADVRPGYFIELTLAGGRVTAIRDFRYVPYIGLEATIELPQGTRPPPP
jgi:RNA polymerase sigma-70 factor (ECF subfamily)